MAIELTVRRGAADAHAVDAALARLDHAPGMYFGVDAGIAGLHPLQAALVDEPALALAVYDSHVHATACTGLGEALLAHAALAGWADAAGNGALTPVAALRALLGAFVPRPEVMLLGALRFNAWRLGPDCPAAPSGERIGVLYLPQSLWRRDASGAWEHLALDLPGAAVKQPAPAATAPPPASTRPASAQAATATATATTPPVDDHPPGGHARMVTRALAYLRAQPLVSLTLSQSFRRATDMSAAAAFARLRRVNPAPATFFLNDGQGEQLFGASPDLQLVVSGRAVQALPVCGTVARGAGPVGEAESFRELVNEDVDAASLAVCSDALRNDLAPLCVPGTLRLRERRRQMSLTTVVHTVDRIEGTLREGADAWDALCATAAPAMVTGTPRAPALAAIAALEASPRGWYGGLAVQVDAMGDALVGTLLRAAVLRGGVAEVRTGGDLLADSVPEREEAESRLKAVSLWRALGLQAAAPAMEPAAAGAADAPPPLRNLPQAVALVPGQDPFADGLRDMLLAMGVAVREGALLQVRAGGALHDRADCHVVAVGDAALRLLAAHGCDVVSITPEHGRLVRCMPAVHAPLPAAPFTAARYATLALASGSTLPTPWTIWARDDAGTPVAAVHEAQRLACLLVRPDSLLAGDAARALLASALALCAPQRNAP